MTDAIDPTKAPTPRRKAKQAVTTIAGREMKPSTLMMGHGYDPVLSEGSLKAPIFLTSTFAFENAAAGKRHFEGITGKRPGGAEGLVYSRFNGPNQEILEDRLAIWDGAEDALVFSSGMTAICVLMMAYCSAGDVIVHSGPLYAASEGFVAKVLSKFNVTYVDFPAGASREELDGVLAKAQGLGAGSRWESCDDLPRKPGQSDQCAGRYRGGSRCARCNGPSRLPDCDRQHVPWPPVAAPAGPRRGYRRLFADQICRRAFRSGRGQHCGRQGVDGPGARAPQHDGRHLRSQHRVDAVAIAGNRGTADGPRRAECGKGLRVS